MKSLAYTPAPVDLTDMKVLLIYPPGSYLDMPTLGIPCLTGYLKAKGVEVDNWDSNLEFISYLLNPNTIREQERRIRSGEAPRGTPTRREQMLFSVPYICDSIADALKTFHDPERYYDVPQYNRAVSVVQAALELYSTEPDLIDHTFDGGAGFSIRVDANQLPFSLQNLIQYAKNPETYSLIRRFFRAQKASIQKKAPYDVVGFSCANPGQILPTLLLAAFFREEGLAKNIVLGGSFATIARNVITNSQETYDFFDYIITFEGEQAFHSLLEAIKAGGGFSAVPNLHYRTSEVIAHTPVKKIDRLDDLPTPDFSGLPLEKYWTPEPVLPTYCTRGCYYDICEFCNHHENYFGEFRSRSTDTVIQDLKTYEKKYGATKLFFVDELLVPKQHIEIAERITAEGLPTKWYSHSRVENYFTKDRMKTLAKGGATLLHVGMESANTRVLKLMKKGYDRERVLRFLGDLREVPMSIHLNTIQSFPGEQPDEYIETLETAFEYAKAGDFIHLYPFGLVAGSPISKGGNPYIAHLKAPDGQDLLEDFVYETRDIRPPTDQERARTAGLRARLGQNIPVINEIYPRECCWAAHLLYIAHHRANGRSDTLDQPLHEADDLPAKLGAFSNDTNLHDYGVSVAKPVAILNGDLFDIHACTWSAIPPKLAEWINRKSRRTGTIQDLLSETGLTLSELKANLYRLCRMGIVQLSSHAEAA